VAAAARVGDSLLGDPRTAIELLVDMVDEGSTRTAPEPMARPHELPLQPNSPLTPPEVYASLSRVRPPDAVIVNESTSTMAQQFEWLPTVRTGSFFATASGGIGWGVPAAVGVALGDRDRGVERPVVGLIGDGSFQYSVQALWTAAQHGLPIVYVVMRNQEYSILKSFAELEETPGVPGLDLPGIDIASVARGFGCRAVDVETTEDLEREFAAALTVGTTTVIVVSTQPQKAML
ncbi:thiamine pyrophosphate-dependent enzyme, partial [Streptomyces sp. NPDC001215]